MQPRSLTYEQVSLIADELGAVVRNSALLHSALARPLASAAGADAYPSLEERVGALLISLAENQPYLDGNKRVAYVATATLLRLHGWQLTADTESVLELMRMLRRLSVSQVAEWLRLHREAIAPS